MFFLLFAVNCQILWAQPARYTVFKYDNGAVSSEGVMRDEKPDGYWKTYYPTGVLKSEGNRRDFLLDSLWRFYNEEGQLTHEITYAAGKKNGAQRIYANGVLTESYTFENDVKVGEGRYYYPTGELKRLVFFSEGKEHGEGFEYDLDGRIITLLGYKQGNLTKAEKINRYDNGGNKRGTWMLFHPNGQLAEEGNFMNNKRNGIFKFYDRKGDLLRLEKYRDGELVTDTEEAVVLDLRNTYYHDGSIRSSGGYVDGKKEGTHRIYNPDGTLSGGELYKGGIKVGEGLVDAQGRYQGQWKLYHDSGELRAEGAYENSNRTGDWIFYHKNGKVEHRGKYVNGLPHGLWKWFYENGNLRREETYKRGKEEGIVTEYNEEGEIMIQGNYEGGLREGEWFYHVGDQIEKGKFRDGERTGTWVHEYPDGTVNFKGNFSGGLATGKHTWFHPNGRPRMEGKFSSGVRVGTWRSYDEDGLEYLNIKYKNGRAIKINGKRVTQPD